jgi:hypothetical protein
MIRPGTAASQGFLGRGSSAALAIGSQGLLLDDEGPTPEPTVFSGSPTGRSEGYAHRGRARRFALLYAAARLAGLS